MMRITYVLDYMNVYPQTIGSIEYAYANKSINKFTNNIKYRTWQNLTIQEWCNGR